MKVALRIDRTHNPSDEARWVSRLRENLTSGSNGEGLETGRTLSSVPRQSFTRQRLFAWLLRSRRLVTRYDHKAQNFMGRLQLACGRILWRRL